MVWRVIFFNDTTTTEIYTLSLHDALPICDQPWTRAICSALTPLTRRTSAASAAGVSPEHGNAPGRLDRDGGGRSEEHTSELQSRQYFVCRLLLEKNQLPASSYILSASFVL